MSKPRAERSAKPEKSHPPLPEISVDDFAAESFRVDNFVARLVGPVLDRAAAQGKTDRQVGGQASLSDVKQLLSHLERCGSRPAGHVPRKLTLQIAGGATHLHACLRLYCQV
jgi:hypothetical protein